MLTRVFVSSLLLASAPAALPQPEVGVEAPEWEALVSRGPCSASVLDRLKRWGASSDAIAAPASPASPTPTRLRIPTRILGDWVLLESTPDFAPILTRVRAAGATVVSFASDCSFSERFTPSAALREDDASSIFTDDELTRLASTSAVVVYVWSPHMPLSVDGYSEIREAAEGLEVELVPVLFPASDRAFAAAAVIQGGIPLSGLREARSVELIYRSALVHAPTVIIVSGTRVSQAMPGYRNAKGYREFLTGFLAGERKP